MRKVAAIVAALNEEQRIGAVLEAIIAADIVDEVIVVSDGSTDRTAEVAKSYPGVRTFALPYNIGKGGAMWHGVQQTDADVLVFLDADLIGLKSEQVCQLVRPILHGDADMTIGIFRGGRWWSDLSQRLVPYVSGQRAVKREIFLDVPHVASARMGVEIALTTYAKSHKLSVQAVFLDGVTHPMKEQKLGLARGLAGRMKMYWEISAYIARQRLHD
ncbi:MAG: glycosyltransferase family 2 protein, partial [Abditibacteriales bacterium]|nr:glycosyltransferase family 2 protein [Abditibacteriales bacterium]MDW8368086.1 glycosyltransferase family 2 protein [Abditibacteriales bacterium]